MDYPYHSAELPQVPCVIFTTLQELQAVALMLHRMAFHSSGKVVPLNLDNRTAKLMYIMQVVKYLFFSRSASHIIM